MVYIKKYTIAELTSYINWLYFFHAWGMPPRFAAVAQVHACPGCRGTWIAQFDGNDRMQAREAMKLYDEALRLLRELDAEEYIVRGIVGLFSAWSDGDDILLDVSADNEVSAGEPSSDFGEQPGIRRLCFLRQQRVAKPNEPYLCLADFISPHRPPVGAGVEIKRLPIANVLGLFATAVENKMEHLFVDDDYRHLLVQTLSDRLAEAAAERLHEEVRQTLWGYAPHEQLSPRELFAEHYQGKRPAIGYPSMPDQSFMFDFAQILPIERIGISLTENGMMRPHAAVAGLMLGHPATRHFAVGPIDKVQLENYARRRHASFEDLKRYLAGNLCVRS